MKKTKIWTVAAFSTSPIHGNLAGITLVEDFPTSQRALGIAAELKYPETAFVKQLTEEEFHIRWFTPKYEVDLCGHATLAAAFLIWQKHLSPAEKIKFYSKSGELWAERNDDKIILDFPFEKTSPLSNDFYFDWKKALGGVQPKNAVEAFGALKEYLVELESAEEVIALKPDIAEIDKLPGNGLIVTSKGSGKYDIVSRVFAPQDGIPEDPVTASAHCKLAHYWEERLGKQKFLAYQASERGGELLVERRGSRVFLTGSCVMVSEHDL
jgi:PhzF family phenazine biosynthesis protein